MITLIYALRDNHWIKYVGKTRNALEWRLADHLKAALDGDQSYRGRGIRKMLSEGRIPTITLITIADGSGSKEEIAWIAYFRSYGIKLWNMTDGGDGVIDSTGEVRKKISDTLKQMYKEHPEILKEMALRVLGTKHPKEVIAKMIATRNTPAARKRNSEAQKISSTKRYQDPKEREKLSVAHLKQYEDPNERKKLSVAQTKRYQNPKERLKMKVAGKLGWIKRRQNQTGGKT